MSTKLTPRAVLVACCSLILWTGCGQVLGLGGLHDRSDDGGESGEGGADVFEQDMGTSDVDGSSKDGPSVVVMQGQACPAGTTCAAGSFCVDGYCCSTQCDDSCSACNVTGMEGTCTPVAKGANPASGHTPCANGMPDPSTCGEDGTCDGTGKCALYPLNTTCKPSSCDQGTNVVTPASTCDGNGNCTTPPTMSCAPYLCDGTTACYSTCTGSMECSGTNSCVGGSCGPKSNGASCTMGSECQSGNCVDTVCCNTLCTSGCTSCDLAVGPPGTCANVPSGQDPNGACPAGVGANAACTPGGCNGSDNCLTSPTTTQCQASTCSSGVEEDPAFCTAGGTCASQTTTTCAPYSCNGGACATTCSASVPCVSGYYCDASSTCQAQKGAGDGCAATDECTSGLTCLDGVCCMTSTCPQCLNCGSGGACNVTVANGPDNTATVCNGADTCSATGACLGGLGTACASGTQCASGNCLDGVCCSTSTCPACMNCTAGAGNGTCTTAVTNKDDPTPNVCEDIDSCSATGTCVPRWSLAGTVAVDSQFDWFAASGTKLYFGNANDQTGGVAQYFKSYDVSANAFANESLTNDDPPNGTCYCGYVDGWVHGNGFFFSMANDGLYYAGSATGWQILTSYPNGPMNGEVATTSVGNTIWRMGGRGPVSSVFAYTFTSASPAGGTWSAAGAYASLPIPVEDGCAAAYNGNVYVFGGETTGSNNSSTLVYNIANNTWTTLPASGNFPGECYDSWAEGYVWNNQIVIGDQQGLGLWVFSPTTNTWATSVIPLPNGPTAGVPAAAAVPSNGDLYAITYSTTGGSVSIWQYVLP